MSTPRKSVHVTYDFQFSPERVFDAWTDPEKMRKWLFSTPTGEIVNVECDARVGGKFLVTDRRNGEDIDHVGEFTVLDRPTRLAFRFLVPKYTIEYTLVTVDIEPTADGCRVTLTHEGVWEDYAQVTQEGWGKVLSTLYSALRSE